MLKLSNSFCRFLRVTCERVNCNANVKFTSFSEVNSSSPADYCRNSHRHQPICYGIQTRLYANAKKRYNIKRQLLGTDDKKKSKQMTDPLRPTLGHTSFGGQFEIIPNESPYLKDFQESNLVNGSRVNSRVPPDFRVWEPVAQKTDGSQRFTVLSYNVLAQYLLECHPYLYTDCSPHNLKWKVRAAKLYDEILSLSPDILCLQEVQASHLNSFYAKFEHIGYYGVFKRKTGHRHDGCAIYFKQSMFELQDQVSVEYYQPRLAILNRDNIGVMVKLVPKCAPHNPIVVVTTHLLYNPKRTDVRLAQMQVLLAEIDRFAFSPSGNESCHLPIIMTGDFNSTPDSAVVQLLDNGLVSATSFRDNSDWVRIGVTDNCQHLTVQLNRAKGQLTEFSMTEIYNSEYSPTMPESTSGAASQEYKELFNSGVIAHSLPLISVYNKMKQDGNCEATTFADYWVTVDYIYFSNCSALKLVERLRLPTAAECEVLGRMPNEVYGSDHLALAATFEI